MRTKITRINDKLLTNSWIKRVRQQVNNTAPNMQIQNAPASRAPKIRHPSIRIFGSQNSHNMATNMLDQQLWCWGRDIAIGKGNILLKLGFNRIRKEGESSCYFSETTQGTYVALWGFGILIGHPEYGSIFIRRYGFEPLWHREWNPGLDNLDLLLNYYHSPCLAYQITSTRKLVIHFCEWAAVYEHWLLEHEGINYRRAVLEQRNRRATFEAENMAATWEQLSKKAATSIFSPVPSGPWGRNLSDLRKNGHLDLIRNLSNFKFNYFSSTGIPPRKEIPS